eukprot:CAMPEP_0196600346 /NCGR_PEP_ID=MMETSP1081-20130531/95339_1 /TAXON_ID=36882 /ORGANISM="Pyramimonas amylifera, Strain CCMP720" /LENGTH=97 /DNA_ID=CAMNT_0041926177 /DNA_START=438 /DNA_END=731 /DNA_ORIENTATION=-
MDRASSSIGDASEGVSFVAGISNPHFRSHGIRVSIIQSEAVLGFHTLFFTSSVLITQLGKVASLVGQLVLSKATLKSHLHALCPVTKKLVLSHIDVE